MALRPRRKAAFGCVAFLLLLTSADSTCHRGPGPSGGAGGTAPAACVTRGNACTFESACCMYLECVDNVCTPRCGAPDASCESNGDCCSGQCVAGACK